MKPAWALAMTRTVLYTGEITGIVYLANAVDSRDAGHLALGAALYLTMRIGHRVLDTFPRSDYVEQRETRQESVPPLAKRASQKENIGYGSDSTSHCDVRSSSRSLSTDSQ